MSTPMRHFPSNNEYCSRDRNALSGTLHACDSAYEDRFHAENIAFSKESTDFEGSIFGRSNQRW